MILECIEIIEADIRGELEFEDDSVFADLPEECSALLCFKTVGVQAMPNAHLRHRLPERKRILHAGDAVRHVVAKRVVLAGMHANDKIRIPCGNFVDLLKQRLQLRNVIDLFPDKVAPGYVRVKCRRGENGKVLFEVVRRCHGILDNGERNAPHGREEADENARLAIDCRHYLMNLNQHIQRLIFLHQRCVADFNILNSLPAVLPRNPEKTVLKNRIVPVFRVFAVTQHLPQIVPDIGVRNTVHVL